MAATQSLKAPCAANSNMLPKHRNSACKLQNTKPSELRFRALLRQDHSRLESIRALESRAEAITLSSIQRLGELVGRIWSRVLVQALYN